MLGDEMIMGVCDEDGEYVLKRGSLLSSFRSKGHFFEIFFNFSAVCNVCI
jgi:hypothetical protein